MYNNFYNLMNWKIIGGGICRIFRNVFQEKLLKEPHRDFSSLCYQPMVKSIKFEKKKVKFLTMKTVTEVLSTWVTIKWTPLIEITHQVPSFKASILKKLEGKKRIKSIIPLGHFVPYKRRIKATRRVPKCHYRNRKLNLERQKSQLHQVTCQKKRHSLNRETPRRKSNWMKKTLPNKTNLIHLKKQRNRQT